MNEEELANIIAKAASLSDDDLVDFLLQNNLSEEDMEDVLETLESLKDSEDLADSSIKNKAQDMANEDDTAVKVTEEDTDDDGDVDTATVEKQEPENDKYLTDEEKDALDSFLNSEDEPEVDDEDEPHDKETANDTNSIAKYLSSLRLGGL